MSIRLILFIFFLMHFGQIFAQSAFYYSHIQPYSNEPRDLVEHENGYLVVGYNSLGGPEGNGFLMMLDPNGNVLWEKIEEAPEPDKYEMYTTGTFHNDYFYVGGYRWINNQRRNLLLKVNPTSGNILWKKVFGELPVYGGDNHIQDIHPNEDGLLIAASGYDSISESTVAELIQIDLQANVLWKKIYSADLSENTYSDRLSKIESMGEGFLLTMDSKDVSEWQTSHYIIRTDRFGNEVWRKNMRKYQSTSTGLDTLLWFEGSTTFKDKNVISHFVIDNITDSTYTQNVVIVEFDENGNEIFYKKYPEKKDGIGPSNIFSDRNNNIYIIGRQEVSPPYYSQLFISKLNFEKELLWEKDYGEKDIAELYFCGALTSDGGVLIGGRDLNNAFNAPRFNSILVKTDCRGSTEWDYENCISPNLGDVSIFPNPFSNYFNIHVPNLLEESEISVRIYNLSGQLVDELYFFDTSTLQINTSKYSSGFYTCSVSIDGVFLVNKKLIKSE